MTGDAVVQAELGDLRSAVAREAATRVEREVGEAAGCGPGRRCPAPPRLISFSRGLSGATRARLWLPLAESHHAQLNTVHKTRKLVT